MIEKTKKYSLPIWGEVRFHIEVDATSEKDAVEVAYKKIDDFETLFAKSGAEGEVDIYWDYDRSVDCIGFGDIEEVD